MAHSDPWWEKKEKIGKKVKKVEKMSKKISSKAQTGFSYPFVGLGCEEKGT